VISPWRLLLHAGLWLTLACAAERGTIGAMLAQTNDRRIVVREVPPGLAAAEGGIRADDEILLIDGRDTRGMSAEQVHRALAGEVGEPVKLTLVRGNAILRVTLRRSAAPRSLRDLRSPKISE
jgi:C-terminal processing protease CtpA/Prc